IGAADLDADPVTVDGVDAVLLDDGSAVTIGAIDRATRPAGAAPLVIVPLEDLPGVGGSVDGGDPDAEVRQARHGRVTEVPIGAPERADHAVQDNELRVAGTEIIPSVAANRLFVREDTLLDRGPRYLAIRDCHTNNSCVNRTDSYRRVPSMATPPVARTPGDGR